MRKEDILFLLKLRSFKQMKIDFVNNMKEDIFSSENQKIKKYSHKKKLLVASYPSNTSKTCNKILR